MTKDKIAMATIIILCVGIFVSGFEISKWKDKYEDLQYACETVTSSLRFEKEAYESELAVCEIEFHSIYNEYREAANEREEFKSALELCEKDNKILIDSLMGRKSDDR